MEMVAKVTAATMGIGMRMRKWGKWVEEIREPNKRSRIGLGSYFYTGSGGEDLRHCCFLPRWSFGETQFPGAVFLTSFGFEIEWDESQDPYVAKSRDCQVKNGVCRFNLTYPNQDFLSSVNEEDMLLCSSIFTAPPLFFLRYSPSKSLNLPPTNSAKNAKSVSDGGFDSVYLGELKDEKLLAAKFLHHHHGATAAATEHCYVVSERRSGFWRF